MASNEFSVDSSSDSEVSEIEDYEIEVEGLPNSSDHADEETSSKCEDHIFIWFQTPHFI